MYHPFFFFPRRGGRCRVLVGRFIPPRLFASQFVKGQSLASDSQRSLNETIRVSRLASVEPEALLVKVAEQVKRFNANVGAFDAALEQGPKVLNAVSVNVTVDVLMRVINDAVNVVRIQTN
jgi:hypothetical protein